MFTSLFFLMLLVLAAVWYGLSMAWKRDRRFGSKPKATEGGSPTIYRRRQPDQPSST